MKKYSCRKAHKGRTAYRTPSRWQRGRPDLLKKNKIRNKKRRG